VHICSRFCLSLLTCVFATCVPVSLQGHLSPTGGAQAVASEVAPGITCSPSPCRLPNIQVSNGSNTNTAPVNIAVNSHNPQQMIMGVSDGRCPASGGAYSTNDGGVTWTRSCLPLLDPIDVDGVPSLFYDNQGVVHALTTLFNMDDGPVEVYETHSSDNGITWSSLTLAVPEFGLAAPMDSSVVDNNPTSPFANAIYVSSTQYGNFNGVHLTVSRSKDGGATWQLATVARMPKTFGIYSEGFSHLAVGNDGTLYLSWMESPNGTFTPNKMKFAKSIDGGKTWSVSVLVYSATAVNAIPNTSVFRADSPVIAVDNSSGRFAGRLYITFYNWTGILMQVLVTHSGDGGNSWSSPVPVAPPSDTHDQFLPWISVSPAGRASVTWFDRRDDPANTKYRTYLALSKDGGVTWANIPIATVLSQPGFGLNFATNIWDGSTLYAAWADTRRQGVLQTFLGGYVQ
jgi:hypothetical protein